MPQHHLLPLSVLPLGTFVTHTFSPAVGTQGASHTLLSISMTYLQVLPPLRLPFQERIQHCTAWFSIGCVIPTHNIIRRSNPLEELWICVLSTAMVGDVRQVHIDRWAHGHSEAALRTIGSFGKRKQRLSKPFWKGQTLKLILKDLHSRKVFPCSCSNKLRSLQALLLRSDLGRFLCQRCHSSWEGKGVLLFFGEGLEGFRLRSLSWGRESKNLHY